MSFQIKNTITPDDYYEIRKNIGWNEINKDQIKKALDHSMINISVWQDEECIGVGRIVGDNVLKGMLTDIMIKKEYQKKGAGKLLLTTLIKSLEQMIPEGESFQLEASPTNNNREFYIKCGMKYKPENQDGVYLWIRK